MAIYSLCPCMKNKYNWKYIHRVGENLGIHYMMKGAKNLTVTRSGSICEYIKLKDFSNLKWQ